MEKSFLDLLQVSIAEEEQANVLAPRQNESAKHKHVEVEAVLRRRDIAELAGRVRIVHSGL